MDRASEIEWSHLEQSAEDLYENAPCGYFSTLPNGRFIKVNRTFVDWVGFSRDSLLAGKRFQDLLTIPGKIYHDTHFGPLIQMQGKVDEIAFDIVRSNGTILPVLVNALEVKDATGRPLLNRATVFNATDRRSYERELLAARRKAEDIAREKADMLNMISHDIRNLLSGILGAAKRLEGGELTPDRQKQYLGLLRASAESMMLLANNLLAVSRLEAGKLSLQERPFDVKEFISTTVAPVIPIVESKGLDLRQRLDERIPARLVGDDIKLGQVLGNLLSNAIKFTQNGFVEVVVELIEQQSKSVRLRLAVTDTGIGIEHTHLSSVTDAFSEASTKVGSRYGGTGLGLSLCRKILELYGTDLKVESSPGHGSRIWFEIVLSHEGG
jgi:PAS domain S-box-containing protein